MRAHPFDRYAPFTDVAALKEWSAKPLRKSVRVNTLKCSVERFGEWAKMKGWIVEQVPWCEEGFFVERPSTGSRSGPEPSGPRAGQVRGALGKDLLHLIGGFYIQEAASMLPVVLLDPQPGESVLDMSAAPGSKATQIAARMQPPPLAPPPSGGEGNPPSPGRRGRGLGGGGNCGVLLANDIQEHRLWTLKSALHRCGVTHAIVTKKVGQWFGKHMTERFDRVLCDAPCSAQGTARKDSDALSYCGAENVATMARLQVQLLETAIHAATIGGRIVYSTCTLTPEENEGVIDAIVRKFGGQVEIVDPRQQRLAGGGQQLGEIFTRAIQDAGSIQEWLGGNVGSSPPATSYPLLRLWPQTYDTEGFFCAVLRKVAPTRHRESMERVPFMEERVPPAQQKRIAAQLEEQYGTSFIGDGEVLLHSGEQLLLAREEVANFSLPVRDYAVGLPFAKLLTDWLARRSICGGGRIRLSHEMATLRGMTATSGIVSINDEQLSILLSGRDATCDPSLRGDILILYGGFCIGRALAKNGTLKNNLPRWMVR